MQVLIVLLAHVGLLVLLVDEWKRIKIVIILNMEVRERIHFSLLQLVKDKVKLLLSLLGWWLICFVNLY